MLPKLAAFFLFVSTLATAQESAFTQAGTYQIEPMLELKPVQKLAPIEQKKGTIYLRAIANSQSVDSDDVIPGIGLGYRRSFGSSGIDISTNFSQGEGWSGKNKKIVWISPKVSYLYYYSPKAKSSFYTGGGLGWGGTSFRGERDMETNERSRSEFTGLIPHICLGYEGLRQNIITSFTELTISQPLIPSSSKDYKPSPVAELSIGAGF